MSEGETNKSIDAAAEITDAMMSSLADVVKTVITSPESPVIEQEKIELVNDDSQSEDSESLDSTVDDLVMEGEAAHRSGEHQAALTAFNKAIALDPSNSMAWFNRGVLLESEQDARGARQSFVICLDLDPNHGPALANLAVLLDRIGENDGAVEIAHRALQYFPGHPNLVQIMDANKAAGGVIPQTPNVMPHTQEKLVEQNLTNAIDSGVGELFENAEVATNTYEEKSDPFEDLVHESNVEEAVSEPIVESAQLPLTEPVIEIEEEVIPETDMEVLCQQATELFSQGDAKGALNILKPHLHDAGAQHFDSWRIAGGAMAAMGLDDHAISSYKHALGIDPNSAKCYFNLGALHERKENIESAIKCFTNALHNDSTYMKAASRLAIISESSGDVANLLFARRSLIDTEGGRENLATLLVELAEGESRILENTAGLPPTIPEGPALAQEAVSLCYPETMMMGRALSAAGNHTESVKCWKAMIQSNKTNPQLWIGLARALEAAGDMATAQRCHEKAQLLDNPIPVKNDPLAAYEEPEAAEDQVPHEHIEPLNQAQEQINIEIRSPEIANPVEEIRQQLPEISARPQPQPRIQEVRPEVDLAAAALEASMKIQQEPSGIDSSSNAIANQDIEWYNKGVGLIEDKKYREALSCFDRALPSFADNDEMVIRILNGRGNALYYLEDYPKCVESYHKAMVINPSGVQGKTLYNMGTAYAEMQRFGDAIKCFEQSMPRGLDKDQQKLAKEQIRRCNILLKEQQRKIN